MLRSVIFDLDGVLIDSEPLMRFAFERCYREIIGDGTPPIEEFLSHMGDSLPRIMTHLGLPHDLCEPYREICRNHYEQVQLFPQTRTVLDRLREQGLTLALLTGKDRQRTLQLLERFGLLSSFEHILCSDEHEHSKPHPEGMHILLERLGAAPHEAVMVGDAVNDILCSQQANVLAIAITWGIKPELVQTRCTPDLIIHDWNTLLQTLLELSTASVEG